MERTRTDNRNRFASISTTLTQMKERENDIIEGREPKAIPTKAFIKNDPYSMWLIGMLGLFSGASLISDPSIVIASIGVVAFLIGLFSSLRLYKFADAVVQQLYDTKRL